MSVRILIGDTRERLKDLPSGSVHCIVTSPPYFGLRDYGAEGQIGLEATPEAFVEALVGVFREARRVLRDDGTLWVNLGDSYAMSTKGAGGAGKQHTNAGSVHADRAWRIPNGLKPKDLIGIPWRVAFALQADGWWLRSDIIWHKPNPMPESVTDRPTSAHEHVFLLAKGERYFFDADAVKERALQPVGDPLTASGRLSQHKQAQLGQNLSERSGLGANSGAAFRNMRNVWSIASQPFDEAHFATFPPALPERCIKAATSEAGCCSRCGTPWVRLIDVESRPNAPPCGGKYDGIGKHRTVSGGVSNDARRRLDRGFAPSCTCADAEPVPCTVLDPFGGAGTTGLVADRLGRDAVLIELNPDYAAIAERRIAAERLGPVERLQLAGKAKAEGFDALPLFGGGA